ncbi:MAG: DUF962 domain-containing protein [Steroidobacteraceae bacterium]|nr:DUF962 domain-containing protein [Steroidobacteraceae bacterium]
MRSVAEWFAEYGESHSHPMNKLLHWVCVPLIMLSALGMFGSIPVPAAFGARTVWLNWATLVVLLVLLYYVALSPRLALGIALAFAALLAILNVLASLPWPLLTTSIVIFVVAWIGQFIGHAIEGKRPSFLKDVQFLLIGPLWLVAAVYRGMGIRY